MHDTLKEELKQQKERYSTLEASHNNELDIFGALVGKAEEVSGIYKSRAVRKDVTGI